jgi:hypothetical protein
MKLSAIISFLGLVAIIYLIIQHRKIEKCACGNNTGDPDEPTIWTTG